MADFEPPNRIKHANAPSKMPYQRYQNYQDWYEIPFDDKWKQRAWPSKRITQAPRWCSVDMRDGNQALINPMDHDKKLRFFNHLCAMGYKEIEVGFPAASQTDFDFCRYVVDNNLIPDDVHIQVLTQCRDQLIKRTIEAVKGAKNIILHIYNSTSELQRRVVFEKPREGIKALAVEGATLIKKLSDEELVPTGSNVRFEYSPESFTGTELDFAMDVCEAVIKVLAPMPEEQVIINLPATVEMASANVYADQIEWMHTHFENREKVILSLHPHNDRGSGIAAAELGVLAGADRVEGCLFGNGERTGNVCLVTLAMNLFTQGIDPEVDLSNIQESIDVAQYCNELQVPERWPWAGSLVYTAFSGSHQDAIKKGMTKMKAPGAKYWEVPYLPVDPMDIGRSYEAIVRVNSQSGKGGIAFLLEEDYGIALPKEAQAEFSQVIQEITDRTKAEIAPADIYARFKEHYVEQSHGFQLVDLDVSTKLVAIEELEKKGITGLPKDLQSQVVKVCKPLVNRDECYDAFLDNFVNVKSPLELVSFEVSGDAEITTTATVNFRGGLKTVSAVGNGPIDAYVKALNSLSGSSLTLRSYEQHSLQHSSSSDAFCSIEITEDMPGSPRGAPHFGVGIHANTTRASFNAVTVGFNSTLSSQTNGHAGPVEALESLCSISAQIRHEGKSTHILGTGTGPVAAFMNGIRTYVPVAKDLVLVDYSQSARSKSKMGDQSEAVCAIRCALGEGKRKCYGIGLDVNTNTASGKAVLSSLSLLLAGSRK